MFKGKLRAVLLSATMLFGATGATIAAIQPADAYVAQVRLWCNSEQNKPKANLVLASGTNGKLEHGQTTHPILRNCYQYSTLRDINSFYIPYGMKAKVNYHSIDGKEYTVNPPGKAGAWHNVKKSETTRTFDVYLVKE